MTFAEIACVVVSVAAVLMGYLVGHFFGPFDHRLYNAAGGNGTGAPAPP